MSTNYNAEKAQIEKKIRGLVQLSEANNPKIKNEFEGEKLFDELDLEKCPLDHPDFTGVFENTCYENKKRARCQTCFIFVPISSRILYRTEVL